MSHDRPQGPAPEEPAEREEDAAAPGTPEEHHRVADVVDPATVRRAPRYGRFMTIGVLVGAVLALLLAVLPLGRSDLGTGTVLAVLVLVLAPLGALLGAVVALVLDRRSMRGRTGPDGPAPTKG